MTGPGALLCGRYLLAESIGQGGMGTLYRATDQRTGGSVAVKLLHIDDADDPGIGRALRREARAAAAITSPLVVKVIDLDVHDGRPFLVLEYVPGETLQEMLRRRGRLPVVEALAIAADVARALDAANAAGIVHRDLTPRNLKLADGHVKVLDFGIARILTAGQTTRTQGFSGTPQYSAPERQWSSGDIRADLYSLGIVLYRMLAGRLPFTAPTAAAVLFQHATTPAPALSDDIPAGVQGIVLRCLEKDPAQRFQTPGELLAALVAAQQAAPEPAVAGAALDARPAAPRQPGAAAVGGDDATALGDPIFVRRPAWSVTPHPPAERAAHAAGRRRWALAGITIGSVLLVLLGAAVLRLGRRSGAAPRPATATAVGVNGPDLGAPGTAAAAASVLPIGVAPAVDALRIDGPGLPVQLSAGQPRRLQFSGAAGASVTLALTDVPAAAASYAIDVFVNNADGQEIGSTSIASPGGPLFLGPLPAAGSFLITLGLEPGVAASSATVELTSSVIGQIGIGGGPISIALSRPWQQALLTADAHAGQRLDLALATVRTDGPDCCVTVAITAPDGTTVVAINQSLSTAGATLRTEAPLPADGRYTITVRPNTVRTASLTLTLTAEQGTATR